MKFLAWVDFHARSRFARSAIPEEKWGTTRSLGFLCPGYFLDCSLLASSPFAGYREKYTREWYARGDARNMCPEKTSGNSGNRATLRR